MNSASEYKDLRSKVDNLMAKINSTKLQHQEESENTTPSKPKRTTNKDSRCEGYDKDGHPIIYCHTHGISCNISHGIMNCKFPSDTKKSTLFNQMGGGRDLGFVRVDVQEAGGGTRGFPKAYNRIEYMQQKDGTCRKVAEYKFLEKAGTQYLGTYIDRRHATVAEWVALRPILEVCDIETGYKGGVRRREPWWRQTAATK